VKNTFSLRKSQMQVNSAQDYLTQMKRQIIAKSLTVAPPPQKRRSNTQYIGVLANKADRYDLFVGGMGINAYYPATLGKTYTSTCCVPANTATTTYLV
jgi:hypothetical protein